MERELADSDPGLDALFLGFARRTSGHDMRWVEKIDRRRRGCFSGGGRSRAPPSG